MIKKTFFYPLIYYKFKNGFKNVKKKPIPKE